MTTLTSSILPHGVRFVPLAGVMVFLFTSILLFFFGPYLWPINNHELLTLFLMGAMLAIISGFLLGVTAPICKGQLVSWKKLFVFGAVSSCIMIFPSAYVYTGKMPWEAFGAIFDQGQAYLDFQARTAELEGQRGAVVILRTLTHWAIYAVIPLAVFRWHVLSWTMRGLLFGTILSAASFSLLRGTDQGTFDLGYLFIAAGLVAAARYCVSRKITMASLVLSGRGLALIALAVGFSVFALTVFTDRKMQRFDGRIETLCVGEERQVCVNPRDPVASTMSEEGRFAYGMIAAYMSQGYYGLALSLNREFESTLGLGHSSALTRAYEAFTGDTKLYERSFTFRLREDAWSDKFLWSSIYTWIANDVGFVLTIPVVGFIAWLWGGAWRDAVGGQNDAAGIVFCMLTQTFMYSPANFQLVLVMDFYGALLIWLGIWFYTTRRGAQTVA